MHRTLILGLLATTNVGCGFILQWLIFFVIGVGQETDALFASTGVPQVLFTLISGPLANVLVPMFSGLGEAEGQLRASSTALAVMICALPIVVLIGCLAPSWVPIVLPGFTGTTLDLVVHLVRVQIVGLTIATIYGVVWASAIARGHFIAAEAGLTLSSILSLIATLPMAYLFGVKGVAWVLVARSVMRVAFMLPSSLVRPTLRLKGANLRAVLHKTLPLAAASTYHKSEIIVDQSLASLAPAGSLSLLNLAQTLLGAIVGIINKAIFVPMTPRIAQLYKAGKPQTMQTVIIYNLMLATFLGLSGWILLYIFGLDLLHLFFGNDPEGTTHAKELWCIMLSLGGLLIGLTSGQVASAGYYTLGATLAASLVSVVAFTIGILLKYVGFLAYGVTGIAIGTSGYVLLAAGISVGYLMRILTREQNRHNYTAMTPW
ncbi:MAG: hypothetical protein KTR25_04675 [Myxococcales bacterium]|nr:hypothetical protein [Myxococcales bacterium]